jgi:hypothetical protein
MAVKTNYHNTRGIIKWPEEKRYQSNILVEILIQ